MSTSLCQLKLKTGKELIQRADPRQLVPSTGGHAVLSSTCTHRDLHGRTHQLAEDVLCVRVSPDGKLLAAALLDSTIQVSRSL